ncbi:MAG: hypothetical protein EAX90_01125 [Candidatus Heimdallarchaeota archaeon]|nr:hypothetical protein [Candidatus Heimdallarchaeota archaeon]
MLKAKSICIIFVFLISSSTFYPIISFEQEKVHLSRNNLDLSTLQQEEEIFIQNENEYYNSLIIDSELERTFESNKLFNETEKSLNIDNCTDWNINSQLEFNNIRTEKVINGDAESTEELWTDYIPADYEGNVTRESEPDLGNIISGDYSWYFDIKTLNHSTIVGFDNTIDVSSNSVIFSFSYSLLRNSLGTSLDSNICIRLFFQFDIYIFIWFNGNPSVLSNVTGPGGYADLLVNEADFNEEIHEYSLNITKLGIELFNQEPDQLRSFAIQTWGEDSYEMEFMIDDLSLTDKVNPSLIDLEVNSVSVFGYTGYGSILLNFQYLSQINLHISENYFEKAYWDCTLMNFGTGKSSSIIHYNFFNWENIIWSEFSNDTFTTPLDTYLITLEKWIPLTWTVDQLIIDSTEHIFTVSESNLTHAKIKILINSFQNELEFCYFSDNYIENVFTSKNQIQHDETLQINIESIIVSDIIDIIISDGSKEIIYHNITNSNLSGSAFFLFINDNPELTRDNYTITIFWRNDFNAGIGLSWFEFTTKPTRLILTNKNILVNFRQSFDIQVDFINLEDYLTIDFATISYTWEGGTGEFTQNIYGIYSTTINHNLIIGNYTITITGGKIGFATATCIINVEIKLEDISLDLLTPTVAIPGQTIILYSLVLDNLSLPISEVNLRFKINNQLFIQTYTNESGYSEILYQIPISYALNNINISCSIMMNDDEVIKNSKNIIIDLTNVLRQATSETPIHLSNIYSNDSTFFKIPIIYPYFGENWQIDLQDGFNPISAIIIAEERNISANISPQKSITWIRSVTEINLKTDFILIETTLPEIIYDTSTSNNEILIEITIETNHLPYNGLELVLPREDSWLNYKDWMLYQNNSDLTQFSELLISENQIKFKIYSTNSLSELTYQLKGKFEGLVQITPSTIILGVGTITLTIISTILLIRKKSNVSLDIQI